MPKAGNTNGLVACVFLFTMQPSPQVRYIMQINNKTIIEFGSREELLRPRFVLSASAFGFADITNLCLNNKQLLDEAEHDI